MLDFALALEEEEASGRLAWTDGLTRNEVGSCLEPTRAAQKSAENTKQGKTLGGAATSLLLFYFFLAVLLPAVWLALSHAWLCNGGAMLCNAYNLTSSPVTRQG